MCVYIEISPVIANPIIMYFSGDNSTGSNAGKYSVTQGLIQRYYDYMLGPSAPQQSDNNEVAEDTVSEPAQEDGLLRRRFISNLIRHSHTGNMVAKEGQLTTREAGNDSIDTTICDCDEHQASVFEKVREVCYRIFIGDYRKDLLIEQVHQRKQMATTFEQWNGAALELDKLTDKVEWKQKTESTLYDYQLVQDITDRMREARLQGDYAQLLYIIRTNWVRNLGNMGNVNLYRHSYVGTKYLIDDYIEESKLSLNSLLNDSDLDDTYLMGILQQTRRNIGRTALVLSGGGTFGMFHIGLLATLFELDMLPRVISGSSAGAIVASILIVHNKEEIPALLDHILEMEFNIFNDDDKKSESENFLIKFQRFFKNGTWFDNKHLVRTMIGFLGDLTFREAYNRTGKILNITVSPDTLFEQPRLLNNLTAPNVLIWSAVCASCSLPGIFPSSPLYEKDPVTGKQKPWAGSSSVKFVDGSVDNDLPISRLSEMFNIDHIIACQVNIHVFPILKLSLSCVGGEIEDEFSARLKKNLTRVYNFMANEMIHMFEIGCEIGIAKNTLTKLRSVLSQQYSGDITILPDLNAMFRFKQLLANPTKEIILREITNGARATWRKISIINNHCGQEFALEKAISHLRGRLIVSSSIRNPLQFTDTPIGLIKSDQTYSTKLISAKSLNKRKQQPKLLLEGQSPSKEENENEIDPNDESREVSYPYQPDDEKNSTPIDETRLVLDDNLLETESTKSLLLLQENEKHAHHNSVSYIPVSPLVEKHHGRRKSDSGSRPRNSKSQSFSVASPSMLNRRTAQSSYKEHVHKGSTGHIFPTMTEESPERDQMGMRNDNLSRAISVDMSPTLDDILQDAETTPMRPGYKVPNPDKDIFYLESDNEDYDNSKSIASDTASNRSILSARRHSLGDGKGITKPGQYKTVSMTKHNSLNLTSSSLSGSPRNLHMKTPLWNVSNVDVDDGAETQSPLHNPFNPSTSNKKNSN